MGTLSDQYIAVAPLVYDDGVKAGTYETYWNYDMDQLNMQADRVAMSAKCADKEAAMKFIDGFYDQTKSVEVLFGGISDGCVEKVDDNHYKVLPPQDEERTREPGNGPVHLLILDLCISVKMWRLKCLRIGKRLE